MFSQQGYEATSTRQIALAVGVKQASLYYHFARKEDILSRLLEGTVKPSLALAAKLPRMQEPPHIQLFALTFFDATLLCQGRWNLGALYYLPELRSERFAEFRRDRLRLQRSYGRLIAAGVRDNLFQVPSLQVATTLVFALAESVISMRSDGTTVDPAWPKMIATSSLRLLCCDELQIDEAQHGAERLQHLIPAIPDVIRA